MSKNQVTKGQGRRLLLLTIVAIATFGLKRDSQKPKK